VKALAQRRDTAAVEALAGRVLCHDVRDGAGKVSLPKGARLDAASAAALLALPWEEVHLIALDPGDVHEEDAGRRLAAAVTGDGVEVKGYTGGQWTLVASRRGLLRVHAEALTDVNAHEGMSVFTLFSGQPVEPGETVGKAKVTPLAIAEQTVDSVERVARAARGVVSVAAFAPHTVGVVARESLDARQRARFEAALTQKVDWFGSRLLPVRYAGASARAVADELTALRGEGAGLLVVAGASALDPLDPVFGGLTLLGARMERHGAPAHPGSLLWLARWDGNAVLGMPTCGMFSQATTFDLVLPRILAGEAIGNRELAALGHGGLLSREMAYRFPPYRANAARGELE
jgi:molybdopterin biosynthesis enzyme